MSFVRVALLTIVCPLMGLATATAAEMPAAPPAIAQQIDPLPKLPMPAARRSSVAEPIVLAGRRHRRRTGAIIGGIALGVLGAIAASEAARAREAEEYLYVRRCRRWARLCNRGRDWACYKFDDRC